MKTILAAIAASALLAAPASAQNLSGLLGLASQANNTATMYQYDGCQYQQGIAHALCTARRVAQAASAAQRAHDQYQQQQRVAQGQRLQADQQHQSAQLQLARLCQTGDQSACQAARTLTDADAVQSGQPAPLAGRLAWNGQ